MTETIKTYAGSDVGASQCLVTLEDFIGDMDNAELADDSTVDASDAVTAINGLIWSLERREAENERLRAALSKIADRYPCSDVENMARVAKEALGPPPPSEANK